MLIVSGGELAAPDGALRPRCQPVLSNRRYDPLARRADGNPASGWRCPPGGRLGWKQWAVPDGGGLRSCHGQFARTVHGNGALPSRGCGASRRTGRHPGRRQCGQLAQSSVEIYDPKTRAFSAAGRMVESRATPRDPTSRWADTRSGWEIHIDSHGNSVWADKPGEIYDPATGQSSVMDAFDGVPNWSVVVGLSDGRVLIAGGLVDPQPGEALGPDNFLRSALLFNPASDTVSSAASMSVACDGGVGVPLPDGRAVILGGSAWSGAYAFTDAVQLFTPSAARSWSRWRSTTDLGPSRS